MSQSLKSTTTEIPAHLLALLEAVPDKHHTTRAFTPEMDAAILKFYPVKVKSRLAKALGISKERLRERWEELNK